jgi:uncharacterized protein YraI
MQRAVIIFGLMLAALSLWALPPGQAQPGPEVFVEALGSANVRSGPGQEFAVLGEITAGTEYRVVQQHALVPWLLLEIPALPSGGAWVFKDLVSLKRGDLTTVPFTEAFSELPPTGGLGIVSSGPSPEQAPASDGSANPASTPTPAPAAPVTNLVTATLTGRSNIRYAPGTDYPTIITLDQGAVLTLLARHSGLPWYQVIVEGSPTGTGWVNEGVIEIQGDVFSLPVISTTVFDFPTPSATPPTVLVGAAPVQGARSSQAAGLATALGETLHAFMLSRGLAPRTDREGSVFVMDLYSGENFILNGGVAYSGMSINKIPVLVSYFIHKNEPLQTSDAELVANTMICSENTATNQMMTVIGDGDILAGGQRISDYMRQLGLGNTFVVAPFSTGNPDATPAPVSSVQTSVDQQRTQPDLFNQMTVEEIGWLLSSIYQCAAEDSGPLRQTFPQQINQLECQQMIRVMQGNKIGRLIEAGSQPGAAIAHKHGWINNTHGDAGIVFGPEGAYVLAMVYHQRGDWLEYDQSFPVLEEISRQTWNYFNPSYALGAPQQNVVPETCNIYGETVIADMLGGNIPIPTLPPTAAPSEPSPSPTATSSPTP